MKVEKIRKVEQVSRLEGKDLTEKRFDSSLKEKRKKFQERLQQDAKKKDEKTFDIEKARVDADMARLAAEMRMESLDGEEQEK